MSRPEYTASIFRPVIETGADLATPVTWNGLLLNQLVTVENYDSRKAERLTDPSKVPIISIISHNEINKLHNKLGISPNQQETQELADHIQAGLPLPAFKPFNVNDLLPESFTDKSRRLQLALSYSSQKYIIRDRSLAISAILNFYELEKSPSGVWFDSSTSTSIRLANARNTQGDKLIGKLEQFMQAQNLSANQVVAEPTKVDAWKIDWLN